MWRFIPLILVMTVLGCNATTVKTVPESSRNLKSIALIYKKAVESLGRPPANIQEFMPHLKEFGETEQILRSPEDGQEYVIHWGMNPTAYPAEVLAYEKEGKKGKRYVLWGDKIWTMGDEDLKKARFPSGFNAP